MTTSVPSPGKTVRLKGTGSTPDRLLDLAIPSSFVDRIIRPKETSTITGRSLASIWRDEKAGNFPSRIRLGANSVGYRLSEVMAWVESRQVVTPENVRPVAPGARRGRKPSATREG
ncbi:helix-turn-helix transcriptional regulator [Pelobacter propionicus]|uniref:helix-turn-helix transcriptional regulator n=1 Tax=Pelobacter propionicus TaxID=29543 RepID=UPI000A01F9F9|nr:AlpA family phage regulatory protein [Pelobacter propionicus]